MSLEGLEASFYMATLCAEFLSLSPGLVFPLSRPECLLLPLQLLYFFEDPDLKNC